MRWSYVGKLGKGGVLDWGGNDSGNVPVSGSFLPDWEDTKLYLRIKGYAQEGRYHGRRVDWGASAIKVNGAEMLTVLEECYGSTDAVDPETLIGKYAAFARKLGPEHYVALVAAEM